MDRIRIAGGAPLNGSIPISGAKNAALPLMIASLLTDETLELTNVPRLADIQALLRILGNHGVDHLDRRQAPGPDGGDRPDDPPLGPHHHRHHRSLRARLDDAGELLGDRAARRAARRGRGLDARRLRHRHAPGRPPAHGPGAARRRDRDRCRLRHRPGAEGPERGRDRLPEGHRRRHPCGADGGGARQRHDGDRERGARARGRRSRRLPRPRWGRGSPAPARARSSSRACRAFTAPRTRCCPTASRPAPTPWRWR